MVPKPSWFDWLTIAAIVLGPVLAFLSQRVAVPFAVGVDRRLRLMQWRNISLPIAFFFVAISLAGCLGLPPRPPDLYDVPIGPPPENYDAEIRQYFRSSLLDPYSAVYEMRAPVRGWEKDDKGAVRVMWVICGMVNAKNRFGGYVGARPFFTMFHQGRVVVGFIDHEPPKYTTSFIVDRCVAWYGAGARS